MVFALLLTFFNSSPAKTSPTLFSDKKRTVKISVDYTLYEWWLLSWKTSEVVCQVYTEHESWPDYSEVLYFCGATIQKQWMQTNACLYSESVTQPEECQGLYLHLANVTPLQKEVEVNLPPAEVFISVVGCDQAPGQNNCTSLPYLRFQAYEIGRAHV